MEYGCIGEHLSHSFSKIIHNKIDSYKYELCEIAPSELESFMKEAPFLGINVTIPYKEQVIPYLDYVSRQACEIGSVNTIFKRQGKLHGCNTDYFGLKSLVSRVGCNPREKKVAILGSGGASKTAAVLMNDSGAREVLVVSRHPSPSQVSYDALFLNHADVDLIINTTPVGMYPNNNGSPLNINAFKNLEGVVDLVYNPLRTNLVLNAMKRNIRAEGGLYMLVAQAVLAAQYFTDKQYDNTLIDDIYYELLSDRENIVLVSSAHKDANQVAEKLGSLTLRDVVCAEKTSFEDACCSTHSIIVLDSLEQWSVNEINKLFNNSVVYLFDEGFLFSCNASIASLLKIFLKKDLIRVVAATETSDEAAQKILTLHYSFSRK